MEFLSVGFLAGALVAAGVGAVASWQIRKLGEASRLRAHEANCRESVRAAGRARDRARAETEELAARLGRVRDEHEQCVKTEERLNSGIARLEAELQAQASGLSPLESSLAEKEARIAEQQESCRATEARLAALAAQFDERTKALNRATTALEAVRGQHAGCGEAMRKSKERIAELLERVRESDRALNNGAPAWLLPAPDGDKDDLQAIRGLGPVLERDLNRVGIFHFHQLAKLTPKSVDWLATRIHIFPGRILKDRWIDQARRMNSQNNRRRA